MKRVEITPTNLNLSPEDLAKDYPQICVWPGTIIQSDQIRDFEVWMQTEFGTRILFMFTETTIANNEGPGGRADVFFRVHKDDTMAFALKRFSLGIRWWEDVIAPHNYSNVYESDLLKQYAPNWDASIGDNFIEDDVII